MSQGQLYAIAAVLVIVGLVVSGTSRTERTRVGNTAFTVFGSIRQTFLLVGQGMSGERPRTPRDWIGWSISGAGLIVGLITLFE